MSQRRLVAEALDGESPIHVAAKGTFQRDPFALEGEVGAIAQLRGASGPYPVKLKGTLGANDVAIDGMIDEPLAKQGLDVRVDLDGQDIQDVLATLGVPIPKMPIYRLRAQLHRDDQVWRLDDLTGRVGASLLAGRILVDAGPEVPYIRADLTSSFLDSGRSQGTLWRRAERPIVIARGGEPDERRRRQGKRPCDPRCSAAGCRAARIQCRFFTRRIQSEADRRISL